MPHCVPCVLVPPWIEWARYETFKGGMFMAKSKPKSTFDATLLLQIALVLFLITLGIVGLTEYNSRINELGRSLNRLFGRADNPANLIAAIAELVAGIIIGVALFVPVEKRVLWMACLVIAILWVIKILWVYVFYHIFEPDFATWLNGLSADLIVLVGLWITGRRYA